MEQFLRMLHHVGLPKTDAPKLKLRHDTSDFGLETAQHGSLLQSSNGRKIPCGHLHRKPIAHTPGWLRRLPLHGSVLDMAGTRNTPVLKNAAHACRYHAVALWQHCVWLRSISSTATVRFSTKSFFAPWGACSVSGVVALLPVT